MTEFFLTYAGELRTQVTHGENKEMILVDAPKDNKGLGEYFSPTDLFAASLASCMLTVMGIKARALGVDMSGAKAHLVKEMATSPQRRIGKLNVHIEMVGTFDDGVKKQLESAANTCPVHHSLHPDIEVNTTFIWGGV